ncbi:MAG TPA: hypothetical protein VKX17_19480 [Planctomycetota bacterium]|nr:hypothetical protein [Planctomycetota bacterium]
MPKIYRTMLPDSSGTKPKLGCVDGPGLGVRVPPDPNADVFPDQNGDIMPQTGGMSAAPSVGEMLPHLIPKRMKHVYSQANGSNKRDVWFMGEGPFANSEVAPSLKLRLTSSKHGLVEPDSKMPIGRFQILLSETQDQWRTVE